MTSIPASAIVQTTPGVIGGGGSALDLQGLLLTTNSRVPIGSPQVFASAAAVTSYFGGGSAESEAGSIYFLGFDNSNKKPGSVIFAQYNTSAVSAWLRGGSLAGMTLAQLKALTPGTLTVTTTGTPLTSGTITLSGATSFSDAASIIQTAFSTPPFSVSYDSVSGGFVFTTTATGATATLVFATSVAATAPACTTTGTVLTIGGTVTGTFHVGDVVSGTASANSLPSGCTILSQISGSTGLAGTYNISAAGSPSDLGTFTCTATGPTGALAVSLALTSATGAALSQGAAAATPAGCLNSIVSVTTDWVAFTTLFNPDNSGNTNKLAFAAWNTAQSNRYAYICWDTDASAATSSNATSSMGRLLDASQTSGVGLLWTPNSNKAVMVCGMIASIDTEETNGRINLAFRAQSGQAADVTDLTTHSNLLANGYSFYGKYATGNDQFVFLYNGSVSGQYKWLNTYIYQIWLNNACQLALMSMLTTMKSLPYNQTGYAMVHAWLYDPIKAAVNFGAIRPGVSLSEGQKSAVNTGAGMKIDDILSTQGWYLQVLDATAQVRSNRGTPPCTLWYMDGGDINQINLASIEVQ